MRSFSKYVCFLLAAWQEVEQNKGDGDGVESTESQGPIQYTEKTPSVAMKSEYLHLHLFTWITPFPFIHLLQLSKEFNKVNPPSLNVIYSVLLQLYR